MEENGLIIITGLSGAGKSEAMHAFEDLGFFCIDNLPANLIPKFAELYSQSGGKVARAVLVVDIRSRGFFDSLLEALDALEEMGLDYEILFLEASDEVLVRRFKETRRRHPLASEGSILEGIKAERRRLDQVRGRASRIIDTSTLTARQLKEKIQNIYGGEHQKGRISIAIISFGFKYGLPMDADLVFDCRFLPNPHYVDALRPLTGQDERVREYVLKSPLTRRFQQKLHDFVTFLLPHYLEEGKAQLVIGIGCTGGRHRSVTLADELAAFLRGKGYNVSVEHRDIEQ
ncbi:MAG TPA: RNase adapter RapZ [Firmicutes bacterium]|nr:RNase adapter RapZ [Bacillota bacterium]